MTGGYIFFGTVNNGSTAADCWCGNILAYVTVYVMVLTHFDCAQADSVHSSAGLLGANSVTGEAGENNCYPCNGGALAGGVVRT